ncbi:MAG: hypothetical protein JNK45_26190 [Myxococcales bacterium]|nr:hypothetical protein [Myxococcales bacterium]
MLGDPPPPRPTWWRYAPYGVLPVVTLAVVLELWVRLDGVPPVGRETAGDRDCLQGLYETFREQATHYGLAAVPLGLLAMLATVLVAVVPPAATPDDAAGLRGSMVAAMRAQPRVPLTAAAAVLWLGVYHHVDVQNGARELAAAAIDSAPVAVPSTERATAEQRACGALRAQWERKLGAASNGVVDRLPTPDSIKPQQGVELATRARTTSSQVLLDAKSRSSTENWTIDPKAARAFLDDLMRLSAASDLAVIAVEQAQASGADPVATAEWKTRLDRAKSSVNDARIGLLGTSSAATGHGGVLPDNPTPEAMRGVKDAVEEAAETVKDVSTAVEKFHEDTTATEAPD